MRRRWAALLVAAAAGGIAAEATLDKGGHAADQPVAAPALPREVLVGPSLTAAATFGRPLVVAFWASWCLPCRQEAPELARFAADPPLGARLVAVDFDEGRARGLRFAREHGWRFTVLRDAGGRVGQRFGVIGLPTTFIVDGRGLVRRQLRGPQTAQGLARAVRDAVT